MATMEIITQKGLVIDGDGGLAKVHDYVAIHGSGQKPFLFMADGYPAIRIPGTTRFSAQFLKTLADIAVTEEDTGSTNGFSEITLDTIDGVPHFTARYKRSTRVVKTRHDFRDKYFLNLTVQPHVELPSTILEGDPRRGPWTLPKAMEDWLVKNLGKQAVGAMDVNAARRWNWAIAEDLSVKNPKTLEERFVASFVFYENIDAALFKKQFGMVEA